MLDNHLKVWYNGRPERGSARPISHPNLPYGIFLLDLATLISPRICPKVPPTTTAPIGPTYGNFFLEQGPAARTL